MHARLCAKLINRTVCVHPQSHTRTLKTPPAPPPRVYVNVYIYIYIFFNLTPCVVSASEIRAEKLNRRTGLFSRVFPPHPLRVVSVEQLGVSIFVSDVKTGECGGGVRVDGRRGGRFSSRCVDFHGSIISSMWSNEAALFKYLPIRRSRNRCIQLSVVSNSHKSASVGMCRDFGYTGCAQVIGNVSSTEKSKLQST